MKKCAKCGIEKDESEFYKSRNRKDGFQPYCKVCEKIKGKKYRTDNEEKVSSASKEYYQKNKEAIREKHKKYNEKNSEKKREWNSSYYQSRIEHFRRKHRQYGKKHVEEAKERRKKWVIENPERNKEYFRNYDPLRKKAHWTISNALRGGKVKKPEYCEVCDMREEKLDAHHHDYSKPLEVIWCCKDCHGMLDRLRRKKECASTDG